MAATNGYCSTAELRVWLGDLPSDVTDAALEDQIEAASRKIDKECDRFFFQLAATTKTYTATDGDYLSIDDLVSVTTLATDANGDRTYGTTWAVTDYDLTPDNASADGMPYTAIVLSPRSAQWFPTIRKAVQITGTWGWPSVPDAIKTATLILAARLYHRKDSPFGVAGSSGVGEVVMIGKTDADVVGLIGPYRRFRVLAI